MKFIAALSLLIASAMPLTQFRTEKQLMKCIQDCATAITPCLNDQESDCQAVYDECITSKDPFSCLASVNSLKISYIVMCFDSFCQEYDGGQDDAQVEEDEEELFNRQISGEQKQKAIEKNQAPLIDALFGAENDLVEEEGEYVPQEYTQEDLDEPSFQPQHEYGNDGLNEGQQTPIEGEQIQNQEQPTEQHGQEQDISEHQDEKTPEDQQQETISQQLSSQDQP